jgi:hypothetical protein
VRRLVLAGAPIDVGAGESQLSRQVADIPVAAFENLVRLGDGRVLGRHVLDLWAPALAPGEADHVLQLSGNLDPGRARALEERFAAWYARTVDLPGTYYLEVIRWLFKENRIAEGRFVALGHAIDLSRVRTPMVLLAARDDDMVAPGQLFATARLIGTRASDVETATEPCGHLSLFLGARTLGRTWRRIAQWLRRDLAVAAAS